MADYYVAPQMPKAFLWRRLHSLTGLWFTLFLMEHLFVNSQAALLIGDNGNGFVRAVNAIRSLPYLPIIEISLLAIPFLIHAVWGIKYLLTAKMNAFPTDGTTPALTRYSRNQAYTWQRLTSWVLLVGIFMHVIHMRFIEYPVSVQLGTKHHYMVSLKQDKGLYTLSKRIGFDLYDSESINQFTKKLLSPVPMSLSTSEYLIENQAYKERLLWSKKLNDFHLKDKQVLAVAENFGVAELLMVRDVFKSPIMMFLYTGLVIAACFHGFNGLWTFMIRWGFTLTARAQFWMKRVSLFLMVLISFLGLAAIWGTYWINLKS